MKTHSCCLLFRLVSQFALSSCFFLDFAGAATLTEQDSVTRVQQWMQGNPVFLREQRSVGQVSVFPETGGSGAVYLLRLVPSGYVIANSDDTLPVVLGFSESSPISLRDHPNNALRAMLLKYVETTAAQLANSVPKAPIKSMSVTAQSQDVLIGPLLETSWDQCNPYNLNCPVDSAAGYGYDGRVPTGCVPTAFAQVMKFHRWPIHGKGGHSYTDNNGSMTGTHTADFSDAYDWDAMAASYDYGDTSTPASPAKLAVSELMRELGVAAEADYEEEGTASSTEQLGFMLGSQLHYGQTVVQSEADAIAAVEADLRAGLPAVVTVPGHAMVVDGLMVSSGVTSYHLNYGWGGQNNGWFEADAVSYGPLDGAVTSIVPQLMPFPVQATVTANSGQSTELQWYFPRKRGHLAQQVQLYRRVNSSQTWSQNAATFGKAVNAGWSIDNDSQRSDGSCWTAGPNGPATLDFDETFVPTATSELQFWRWAILLDNAFRVLISNNNGASFNELVPSLSNQNDRGFKLQTISLAPYAGQSVKLRFELIWGSPVYTNGGIWIDDLSVTNSTWSSWSALGTPLALSAQGTNEQQPLHTCLFTPPAAGNYELAAAVIDDNQVEQPISPSFALTATGETLAEQGTPYAWLTTYGGVEQGSPAEVFNAAESSDPYGKGLTLAQEYVFGTIPTNPTSRFIPRVVRPLGGGFQLEWTGVAGRTYRVMRSSSPAGATWVEQSSAACTTAGQAMSWTDLSPLPERGFYRIAVSLTP